VLPVVLHCDDAVAGKVRYVFDTLFQAAGILVRVVDSPPTVGVWLLYSAMHGASHETANSLFVAHCPDAWAWFDAQVAADRAAIVEGLSAVLPSRLEGVNAQHGIGFDIVANAFYFLSSWSERVKGRKSESPQRHGTSDFVRLGVPPNIVDLYLDRLLDRLRALCLRTGLPMWLRPDWPAARSFAVVLSHDVDFLPVRRFDNTIQGAKTVLRHLLRQRDPGDAWRAARGWLQALTAGRDPYGCVPEIIAREQALGVRSSFQVAVGHRHANDVNYRIEDDNARDYLRAITDAGFDLCLHGSYRSTENIQWYVDEVALLSQRLARPLGSRQHFLSFDYDNLFDAQEAAGIQYDMSMGFPDQPGPRAGFSYPYFPYNLREDRPYRVLQISLFLMDVTLRGYMGLRPAAARDVIGRCLDDLKARHGCASAVWHPIVFGGARDPGYDTLYFDMVEQIGAMGGLATDGRTINAFWRSRAACFGSFAFD
jgi:hypothetical protein